MGKLLPYTPSDFIHSAFCGVLGLPNFGAGFVFPGANPKKRAKPKASPKEPIIVEGDKDEDKAVEEAKKEAGKAF